MSEFENNTQLAEDDEISLIDLFSVLIKHRFMIIAGTIAVAFLGVFYFFGLPKLMKSADKHEVTIEYTYQIDSLPPSIEQQLGFNDQRQKIVVSLANYNMSRLTFLAQEVKKYNPFGVDLDEMTPYQYNGFIQGLVKNKMFKVEISPMQTELKVTITVPETNVAVANQMLADMANDTTKEIENYLFPKIDAIDKAAEDSLALVMPDDTSSSTQKLKDTQVQIKNFRTTYSGFLTSAGEPFILLEPLGRLKKLVILVFAAFFVLVFVAFLLNAVENIKKDPEASGKIKTAWDGGKISKKK